MLGYSNIPELWKESLYEVEDIPFAYTEVSLNKLYELSLKQALQVIEQEGGSVQGEQVVIKTQQPVAVKYEKALKVIIRQRRKLLTFVTGCYRVYV